MKKNVVHIIIYYIGEGGKRAKTPVQRKKAVSEGAYARMRKRQFCRGVWNREGQTPSRGKKVFPHEEEKTLG